MIRGILLLILLVFLPIATCANDSGTIADLVFINGRVVTMTSQDEIHEAIAIAGNRILAVGSSNDILAFAD